MPAPTAGDSPGAGAIARLDVLQRRTETLRRAGLIAATPGTLLVEDADGRRTTLHSDEIAELLGFAYELVAVDAALRGQVPVPLRLGLSTAELAWLRTWLRHGSVEALPDGAAAQLLALPGVRRWAALTAALLERLDQEQEAAYHGWLDALPVDAVGEQARAFAARLHHALRQGLAEAGASAAFALQVGLALPDVGPLRGSLYGQLTAHAPAGDAARAAQRRATVQALVRAFELQRRWLLGRGLDATRVELDSENVAPGVALVQLVATLQGRGQRRAKFSPQADEASLRNTVAGGLPTR